MKKEKQQQAQEHTQELMVQWYMLKPENLYSHLSKNVLWIGTGNGQLYAGRETVISEMASAAAKMRRCSLMNQIYTVSSLGKDGCVVAGTILVTPKDTAVTVNEQHRVTFVWVQTEGKLRITHMHISKSAAGIEAEEKFPVTESPKLYQYIRQKQPIETRTVTVSASNRVSYCIVCDEVDYLEAAKEYMIVNYKGNEIKLHRRFHEVQRELFPDFIIIHRSYCINPRFIWAIKRYQVQLINGKTLPLSRNRYTEVLELLK